MKTIRFIAALFLAISLLPLDCHARLVPMLDMNTLIADSQLVFVGKVKSVKPSGITTALAYAPWKGIVFDWLRVEVEVIEPIKGTKIGEVVQTFMLSSRGFDAVNAPGIVWPEVGQCHLLCLLPTDLKDTYAAVTAPFDDDQAIFLLDRKVWTATHFSMNGKLVPFPEQSEKNRVLWNLVDDNGEINRGEAENMRKIYQTEIATLPPTDALIHLSWKTDTSASGWQRSVPDDKSDGTGTKKEKVPEVPVAKP